MCCLRHIDRPAFLSFIYHLQAVLPARYADSDIRRSHDNENIVDVKPETVENDEKKEDNK